MQVASIVKARAVALVEVDELNRDGTVRFADIVAPLVKKFQFLTYPTKPEEFDTNNGIKFTSGKSGHHVIDLLDIYGGLIVLETLSNTTDSKDVLEGMLRWGKDNLGLTYEDDTIRRWAYISQIAFYSVIPLLSALSPPLQNLARKTSSVVDGLFEEGLDYQVAKVIVGHDPLTRMSPIASFTIEHRIARRFADNKFFSEAPLPTDLHIKLLQELEEDATNHSK
ncbi:MAG: hypothetical protein WBE76_22565 [Terracidiphilus sp.]